MPEEHGLLEGLVARSTSYLSRWLLEGASLNHPPPHLIVGAHLFLLLPARCRACKLANQRGARLAAQVTCLAVAYIGVVLRFVSRRLSKARIEADDYVTVLALVRAFIVKSSPKQALMIRD